MSNSLGSYSVFSFANCHVFRFFWFLNLVACFISHCIPCLTTFIVSSGFQAPYLLHDETRPVWLKSWMLVYELSGCGFESSCSHLNLRFHAYFKQEVPWHSGNFRVWIHSETRTRHDKKRTVLLHYLPYVNILLISCLYLVLRVFSCQFRYRLVSLLLPYLLFSLFLPHDLYLLPCVFPFVFCLAWACIFFRVYSRLHLCFKTPFCCC